MRIYKVLFLILVFSFGGLISCGAEEVDFSGMEAAEKKFQERLKQTHLTFMSLETMFPDPQVRALAEASANGRIDEINTMVSQGVDVNARGTQNATPLFWAMQNLAGFTRLLELGADPNVVYGDGGSIMRLVVQTKDTSYLETVLKFGGDPNLVASDMKNTPIFQAIGAPSEEKVINLLLEAGADINARDSYGTVPLMIAAGRGKFDVVYLLLTLGADYRLTDNNGVSLMDDIANSRGAMIPGSDGEKWQEKVIAWLAERGVDIPKKRKY